MRLRHRLVGALGAILIVFVLAAPVAADTTGGGNGTTAVAFHDGGCTDNGDTVTCSQTELDAFKGKVSGDEVCYDELTFTYDENTGDQLSSHESFGCTGDSGNVSVNKLISVDVASTDIELTTVDCIGFEDCTESDGGTVSIAATWTGFGKTLKSSSSFHFHDQFCVEVDRSKSTSRNATFDGPFSATFAQITVGTSSFRIRCS